MNAMAVFLLAAVLTGVLPILLRAKGASVFLMLCVGKALIEIASEDIAVVARTVLNADLPIDDIAKLFLMLTPPVLTLFITKKAAKKRFPLHIIPSVCGGLLAGFWSVSLLTNPDPFETSSTYAYVSTNVSVIMVIGIVSTLFLFWAERPKPIKDQDGKHGKH